jgi:hypothetical protein
MLLGVATSLLRCRPFEDEEPERLEPEVDEAPLAVREVAAEAGAHHALPPRAVDRVKLLQQSNPAIEHGFIPSLWESTDLTLAELQRPSSRTEREVSTGTGRDAWLPS